jgi:hypothetical protein
MAKGLLLRAIGTSNICLDEAKLPAAFASINFEKEERYVYTTKG